jgi:hypothetical protein
MRTSESKDTSKSMILVPLLNPKFATALAAMLCELRVRGTSEGARVIILDLNLDAAPASREVFVITSQG